MKKNTKLKELKDRYIAYTGVTLIASFIIGLFIYSSGENVPEPLFDIKTVTGLTAILMQTGITAGLILFYLFSYIIKRSKINRIKK